MKFLLPLSIFKIKIFNYINIKNYIMLLNIYKYYIYIYINIIYIYIYIIFIY